MSVTPLSTRGRFVVFPAEMAVSNWGLVELIEAAVRAGDRPTAPLRSSSSPR
ncbi:hypothetical protein AB0H36_42465 [Kribbella sp. NPDC050820]|uniref:hypothetical protein n=1 Tax=Kribbella sp. NPDC050820 TaxID=3155408 RepID=UPI0033D5DBF6